MEIILSIETSTGVCSVALHRGVKLLASQELFGEKSHSAYLNPMIRNVFDQSGVKLKELAAVAISEGPGSYTGLRIGTSTAKGLCFALDIPLIAVNTLKAMAYGINKFNYLNARLCPMLDARRMEVYSLVASSQLDILEDTTPKIIDESSYDEYLDHRVLFFGNGSEKCKPLLSGHSNAIFIDGVSPSAIHVGSMAYPLFQKDQFEDLVYFEPFYLKTWLPPKPKAAS